MGMITREYMGKLLEENGVPIELQKEVDLLYDRIDRLVDELNKDNWIPVGRGEDEILRSRNSRQ